MGTSHDLEFEKLADGLVVYLEKTSPVSASFLGVHLYDEELADFSEKALAERGVKLAGFRKSFKALNRKSLNPDNRADYDVILNFLEADEIYSKKIALHTLLPDLYLREILFGVYAIISRDYSPLRDRALALTRRLAQVPQVLKAAKANLQNPPELYVESALFTLAGATRFLDEAVPEFAAGLRGALCEALLEAKDDAVAELRAFELHLRNQVLPKAKGVFPLGKPLYEQLLKLEHHLPYTTDQLLKLANTEIATLEAELEKTALLISKKKSWRDILGELGKDHPSAAGLVSAYKKEVKALKQFVADKGLVSLGEEVEVEVLPTPAFALPLIPCVAYMPGAPLDPFFAGQLWVTVPQGTATEVEERLKAHPNAGLALRALHETYPGHHVQLARARHLPKTRAIRHLLRAPLMSEGWAFYCEDLLREQGYFSDPKQRLMALRDALWRAYRVTLDVGLQTKTIRVQQAISKLVEKVGLEPSLAEAEVRRYCQMPTEPISCLVGKLEIKKLAADYAKRAGSNYSQKAFHDELLSYGTLPLARIRQLMDLEK